MSEERQVPEKPTYRELWYDVGGTLFAKSLTKSNFLQACPSPAFYNRTIVQGSSLREAFTSL